MIPPPTRRAVLLLPSLLGACSVLPSRPFREVERFALAAERPQRLPARPGGPVLLLRAVRAAPGLDQRGLRSVTAGGGVNTEFWAEWTAPPAELAEEALRRWLEASGLFAALTAPGSRLRATVVLEAELVRLETVPAAGIARAALSGLLLTETGDAAGSARILGQVLAEGQAPLPAPARGAAPDAPPPAAVAAAAMSAALAAVLPVIERDLGALLPRRP